MRESLKDFFEGITFKKFLFWTIWTIGIICWGYFILQFTGILHEADQAYSEAMKIRQERIENKKDVGSAVGVPRVNTSTEKQDTPDQSAGEEASSLPAPGNIEKKILDKFGKDGEVALAVAKAESHLNPTAINVNRNGTKDAGIFQINDCHGFSVEERFNADKNIEIAFALYQKSGFQPWVTFKTNAYRQFL